jgi:hypothetical protein
VVLAEEALTIGLVNAVVPSAELLPYTYNYVRTLITNVSPGSLPETKRQIYSDLHRYVRSAVADAAALLERMATEQLLLKACPPFCKTTATLGQEEVKRPSLVQHLLFFQSSDFFLSIA